MAGPRGRAETRRTKRKEPGMEIKAIKTTFNRSESSGITTFNDGTKMYWSEGYGTTIIIKSDGTRIETQTNFETTEWDLATDNGNEMGEMRPATQEEEIEYEMIAGNLSREEAEQNITELNAALSQ